MAADAGAGARLDDLERLAHAGTWAIDLTSGAVRWSLGQHRLHGVEAGAVTSVDDWAALVHPEDVELWQRALEQVRQGAAGYAVDHRIMRGDGGAVRWLRSRARLDGGVLQGVSVDTTDQHDGMASVRTFIADAAHELRTPASAIGQAASALEVVDDEQRGEVIAVIGRQAARLRALTTDLVDLAQLDAGPMAIVLQPVPLRASISEAVEHAPPPDDRTVTTDVPEGISVLASPAHLDRVLVNLLTNAYRYGGPNIQIRASAHGERVAVEVADDGEGVPPDAVPGLFQAFRRGPQRHPEASGLGLAIVARLVHRFGGGVSYRAGQPGAVFVLDLERAAAG